MTEAINQVRITLTKILNAEQVWCGNAWVQCNMDTLLYMEFSLSPCCVFFARKVGQLFELGVPLGFRIRFSASFVWVRGLQGKLCVCKETFLFVFFFAFVVVVFFPPHSMMRHFYLVISYLSNEFFLLSCSASMWIGRVHLGQVTSSPLWGNYRQNNSLPHSDELPSSVNHGWKPVYPEETYTKGQRNQLV